MGVVSKLPRRSASSCDIALLLALFGLKIELVFSLLIPCETLILLLAFVSTVIFRGGGRGGGRLE